MSHPAIEPINDAVQEKLAPYEPQGPLEWLSFMQSLPEMFENFRTSLSGLGDKLASDFPMNPEVADRWQDMVAAMSGLDEHAQDMAAKFEQDPRVQRALNPQPREDVMDVQND